MTPLGVTNPTLIVEVLSDNIKAFDRGETFALYRKFPSLNEYVLVYQLAPWIERFARNVDGSWTLTAVGSGGNLY